MRYFITLLFVILSACAAPVTQSPTTTPSAGVPTQAAATLGSRLSGQQVANNFVTAIEDMRPILVRTCREMTPQRNCDFQVVVDDRPRVPPNAFQTVDRQGRPVLGFTLSLIAEMRNRDEIAFVIGHEGAHHILRHLERQRQSAMGGAVVFGVLAAALGGSQQSVDAAADIGASVGARSFSKDFELEADRLGARMTQRGGYDPVRGAAYFTRIPDPRNVFLGTHPPNASRIAAVRAAVGR